MLLPHESQGVLRASFEKGLYRLALDVDPGIVEVARALVPRTVRLNRTRFAPHISVVRGPTIGPAWGRHDGEVVVFRYSTFVYADETYFWLKAESPRLREVRVELGLAAMDWYCRPPDDDDCFHITIANQKPT
jgi:hypothetical protein